MSANNSMKIIEQAYNDHARNLVKWALRKFKSPEDAEDFCSEVMSRFSKAIITKEVEGEQIENVDNYLWMVAYNLEKEYYASSKKKDKLVEELERDVIVETELAESISDDDDTVDTETLLQKLRISITHLDYNLREAVIMFHLEKKSLTEISKKLKVSESYVKKLLYESKQKIRQNDKKNLYKLGKEYRSKWMNLTITGTQKDTYIFEKIKDSLSKQNICRACYEKPRTIEEIGFILGLPSSYIEWDLKWLVEKGFVVKKRDKYATAFFIYSWPFNARVMNVYYKHKKQCLDKVVDKLASLEGKIKAIGFIGSEKPINQLLWLLIYNFIQIAKAQVYLQEHGHSFEPHDKKTGEPYYFIGSYNSYNSESNSLLDPQLVAEYTELIGWGDDQPNDHTDGENSSRWYPIIRGEEFVAGVIEPQNHVDFLYKVCKMGFVIDSLTREERDKLKQCIDIGYLSLADAHTVVPNFYVFTPAQRARFDELLTECIDDVIPQMRELYQDLRKMVKEVLPKQVEDYLDFVSYNSLTFYINMFTTGFAFYDGRLSAAEGQGDFTMLTLSITTANSKVNR